jgi:phenylpropionate dioxygenase-like ring-hydroxylating dioxygenase large terminal subunit
MALPADPTVLESPDRAPPRETEPRLIEPRALLVPPATKGHTSVVKLPQHWFVLCLSRELRDRPIARTLMGIPLVLFRDGEGKPAALLDRCPHRNVPLSMGEVVDGTVQCAYHGWRFGGDGACRFIPSLPGPAEGKARRAPSYPAVEQDGFVWVYGTAGEMPESRPYRFPGAGERGYTTVRHWVEADCTMFAAAENALDVPHTAFLHKGLFRSQSRGIEITAVVRRGSDRVEAEYVGEPRPPGLVARILSPSGGTVAHYDRFILPSIAQVEYRIGTESHFLITSAMTPVTDFHTRVFASVSFRLKLVPGWLLAPFLKPLALRIFGQDAWILKAQTETIRRFGGEQFVSTDIDVLGRHMWRLLKAAERGDTLREAEAEERVTLVV